MSGVATSAIFEKRQRVETSGSVDHRIGKTWFALILRVVPCARPLRLGERGCPRRACLVEERGQSRIALRAVLDASIAAGGKPVI